MLLPLSGYNCLIVIQDFSTIGLGGYGI